MKKKITSKKELNMMALSSGAVVTDSTGKKFNSSKKTAHKKPVEIKPEEPKRLEKAAQKDKPAYIPPQVIEKPKEPDKGLMVIAEKMDDMSRTNAALMAGLMEQISKIQLQSASPVMEWKFDFIRDDKGYMASIHAKAVINKMALN